MLDKCTEILMRRYDPTNALLEWANQPKAVEVEKQADGPSEEDLALLQSYNITQDDILKKREELFKSWGLDTANRHEPLDKFVVAAVIEDARALLNKCVDSASGEKRISLVMSSADYTDKQITAAVTAYNREHPEHMSHSFQLPVTMNGIPANSWVLVLPNGETQ
ncbi:hypothetical protein AEQ67_09855 [Pseudomonas sp. RIT-PI-q]|uniref:hypothetical protein n=1 Tax=Pseudomonas sp. RIT-PI-q TaxID=1690247 RepID=UPI0006CD72F1|nr:hypothetical protein [Pseudomonas sp. RIT-PI-q]KPG99432.1 hypothetical protein AEQ67_09855 [Pseudomonas sp. RIT-PI-q]